MNHGHHPECKLTTFREIVAEGLGRPEWLEDLPHGPDEGGRWQCHPDCPSMKRAVLFGRLLAEKYDWEHLPPAPGNLKRYDPSR